MDIYIYIICLMSLKNTFYRPEINLLVCLKQHFQVKLNTNMKCYTCGARSSPIK